MKFSFKKKHISDVLGSIQGLTGRKTNLSITSDILIQASGSTITITANDLETVFQGTYEANVEKEGILSINSRKFYEIIKEYPDNEVIVNEVENRWIEIGKGDSIFHIVSSDYENFPETPVISDVSFINIKSGELKKMAEVSTIVGFSGEEKRIYVIGVLLEKILKEGRNVLRMVSTDSRRLHCYDAGYTGELILPDESVIIPKKGLYELGKFLSFNDQEVKIGIKDNHFVIKKENESIMIKLLEGAYPDYKPVINYESITPIEIDRTFFSTVLKRVSILTSDDYKSVILNFRENELEISITNPEIGESKEKFIIGYSGNEVTSAFNPKYFIDALSIIENNTVNIHINDSKSPCIIKPIDNNDLICVIMAMHIS
jgi:DNA polymerase-3 subunit beta